MVGRVAGDLLNHVKRGSLSSDALRARAGRPEIVGGTGLP